MDIDESYAFEDPNSSQSQNETVDEDHNNDTEHPDMLQPVKTFKNPQRKDEPTVDDREDKTDCSNILLRAISKSEIFHDDLQDHWGDEVEEHMYEQVFPKPIIDPVASNDTDPEPENELTPAPMSYLNGNLDSALTHLQTIKELQLLGQE